MTQPPGLPWRHRLFGLGFDAIAATRADLWLRPFARGEGVILTFHHVRPSLKRSFAPNAFLEITPGFLDDTVRLLIDEGFEVIPIGAVRARLDSSVNAKPFAVLTFDDGYRDNLEHAWPVLRRHAVPWTLYVTPSLADGSGCLWWVELERALASLDAVTFCDAGRSMTLPTHDPPAKRAAFLRLHDSLVGGDPGRVPGIIGRIARSAGLDPTSTTRELCADWDEIGRLAADPAVTIGSHTLSHPILSRLKDLDAEREIARSRFVVAARIGRPVLHFAYPSGGTSDAGAREFAMAARHGYETAVTTRPGHVHAHHRASPTALPRVSVNGLYQDPVCMRALLSGVPFLPGRLARKDWRGSGPIRGRMPA